MTQLEKSGRSHHESLENRTFSDIQNQNILWLDTSHFYIHSISESLQNKIFLDHLLRVHFVSIDTVLVPNEVGFLNIKKTTYDKVFFPKLLDILKTDNGFRLLSALFHATIKGGYLYFQPNSMNQEKNAFNALADEVLSLIKQTGFMLPKAISTVELIPYLDSKQDCWLECKRI